MKYTVAKNTVLAVIGCFAAFGFVSLAAAQQSRNTTGGNSGSSANGLFGSRSLGSGISSSQGNSGSGMSGTPGSRTTQSLEGIGTIDGNERFSRENQGQFIGADSSDSSSFYGQADGATQGAGRGQSGLGGASGLGGLGGLGGLSGNSRNNSRQSNRGFSQNNRGFGSNNGRGSQSRPIRPQLTVGFVAPVRAEAAVTGQVQQRMERLGRGVTAGVSSAVARSRSALGNQSLMRNTISITMEGRTAVLTGTVSTEHDRALAERLTLLEPGVSAIRNELVVASNSPPSETAR